MAGLLLGGERKSIEPLSRRVSLPAALAGTQDPDQGLQQFVSQSSWDERAVASRYRALLARPFADPAGVFVLDDTTFPKAGSHSVGVQRQYCGVPGKKANCQAAVSLHYVGRHGHVPYPRAKPTGTGTEPPRPASSSASRKIRMLSCVVQCLPFRGIRVFSLVPQTNRSTRSRKAKSREQPQDQLPTWLRRAGRASLMTLHFWRAVLQPSEN